MLSVACIEAGTSASRAAAGMRFAPFPGAVEIPTDFPGRTNTMTQNASAQSAPRREVFSVEGARVTLDAQRGWQCTCAAGQSDVQCAHVEQAQGLRLMRSEKRETDTIELELSPEQLRALSEGLAAEEDEPVSLPLVVATTRKAHRWDSTTLAAVVAVSLLSSGATYLAVRHTEPALAADEPLTAFRIAPAPEPEQRRVAGVTFANPFDASEIFQFPAGTSEGSAREAVAELLLQRARERLSAADELRRQDRVRSAAILAQGS